MCVCVCPTIAPIRLTDCHAIWNQSTWNKSVATYIMFIISLPFKNDDRFVALFRSYERRARSTVHSYCIVVLTFTV